MKKSIFSLCAGMLIAGTNLFAAGPFDPDQWPTIIDTNKTVHFVSTDGSLSPAGPNWISTLTILSSGDQGTTPITLRGRTGLKAIGNFVNTADSEFTEWADDATIDILMQVYGDDAILNNSGTNRNFNFLIGTLPELSAPNGGQIPVEAKNQKWNWVLFRITNGTRASDGSRFVGSIPANAQGASQNGGVNGGTMRLESVPNLIVRAVAFGEQGAFGDPADYSTFAAPDVCEPEPNTNLAFIDLRNTNASHMVVMNGGDQTTEIVDNAGPPNDQRRAVRPLGNIMNFGVQDNFLGLPCNSPRTMKLCVEFYDDPALTGMRFGPDAYATDSTGSIGTFPSDRWYTLRGSGEWIHVAWVVPAVNLYGVNVTPLTGGPRLVFEGGQPSISRFDLGIFRVTPHTLAGIDPLPNCYEDPDICTTNYGNFAELDLAKGIFNGLAPGTSGGDQNMIQDEAGPANDRRMAIRPAYAEGAPGFAHPYLNFAIENQPFGPNTQPNARLAICVTYYDDPALAGRSFRPEVYKSDRNGTSAFAFTPGNTAVVLKGTDRWQEAYFEIPDLKFEGVNQGPQAAARFTTTGRIFVSRVRYAVIRPCGPNEGINLLAQCQTPAYRVQRDGNNARHSWRAGLTNWILEKTDNLTTPNWSTVTGTPVVEGNEQTLRTPLTGTAFFRLRRPNDETN